jgi:hypothetical protein
MNNVRLVPAWCAGRPVEVPVLPSPANPLRVGCPICGQPRGRECINLQAGPDNFGGHRDAGSLPTTVISHQARCDAAQRQYGGQNK